MNPFLRYLADKHSAHRHTDTQTDTRRWPQDLAAYGAQVNIVGHCFVQCFQSVFYFFCISHCAPPRIREHWLTRGLARLKLLRIIIITFNLFAKKCNIERTVRLRGLGSRRAIIAVPGGNTIQIEQTTDNKFTDLESAEFGTGICTIWKCKSALDLLNPKSKDFDIMSMTKLTTMSSFKSFRLGVFVFHANPQVICPKWNSPFLMSLCLRVVPRFGGNVNINKPLAACNGTSTKYMLFSAVLVLIYFKSFHLISALETWNAILRHICLHYYVLCLRVVPRFRLLMNIR